MYNYTKQVNSLIGRVGFKGNSIPTGFVLDTTNKTSESGLYFDYIGSLATVTNITDFFNDRKTTDGDINDMLLQLQKQAINNVLHDLFSSKSEIYATHSVYPYEKTGKMPRTKNGQFVGFKMSTINTDIGLVLERVSLLFDKDGDIPLKLFYSGDLTNPIKEKTITVEANKPVNVDLNAWIVDSSEIESYYYFGYFENDIPGINAIKYTNGESNVHQICSRIERVKIDIVAGEMDTKNYTSDSDGNGLNPQVTVYKDYSSFISNNRSMFDKAIQMQMGISACEMVINSTQVNHATETFKQRLDKAWFTLNGDKDLNIVGLRRKFNLEVERISKALFEVPLITKTTVRT